MNISHTNHSIESQSEDMLAVFVRPGKQIGEIQLSTDAKRVNTAVNGMLVEVCKQERFTAARASMVIIHTHHAIQAKHICVVGLGDDDACSLFDLQSLAATIARKAEQIASTSLALSLPSDVIHGFTASQIAQAFVIGVKLGTYAFHKLKHSKEVTDRVSLISVALVHEEASLSNSIAMGVIQADATIFARNLVNEPPSVTTPTYLARVAKDVASESKDMSVTVFNKAQMEKMGMGALLGIARGSDEEPCFIHLEYRGSTDAPIAIVGKGITFDTGGLSLKPSHGMETMKLDMAGAACVLGVFHALSKLKPRIHVVGLIAATENMPSGRAIKPGDIVTAMNGKTIEVLNTDAEGRVVLADAFSYAQKHVKPRIMIDFATLTGACMVALGEEISGLFSNSESLTSALKQSAQNSGEKIWELPLAQEYKKELETPIADIKNVGNSRYGGAINGALFLQEFVGKDIEWAHIDIAGPSFAEHDAPLTPVGGTGVGVRMILEYLQLVK